MTDPFAALQIPVALIPAELASKTPEDLAFLLKLGWSIYQKVEKVHETNAQLAGNLVPQQSSASAVIGQTGEQYVADIYKKTYQVDDVSKRGRAGDLFIWRETHEPIKARVLVEVKNYSSTVDSAEVDKFYRDLRANQSICGGIFISLNTRIRGIDTSFEFKIWNSMPVIFMVSNDEELINIAAGLIWAHVDSRSVIDDEVYQKIKRKLTRMTEFMDQLSLSRTYVAETKTTMEKQLTKIGETIFMTEMQLKNEIAGLGRTLRKHMIGGVDAIITGDLFNWDLVDMEKTICTKFPDGYFAKDTTHRQMIITMLTKIKTAVVSGSTRYKILYNSKGVEIKEGEMKDNINPLVPTHDDSQFNWGIVTRINFLKSRTDIAVAPITQPGTTITMIPEYGKFVDGLLEFAIDKKYQKEGFYDKANDYIEEYL